METLAFSQKRTYPLGAAARPTSLSPHVLRAWGSRYAAVHPLRTPVGARRYCATDVVFGAHTGLESLRTLNDVWSGALIGRMIERAFWRIPAHAIPAVRSEGIEWLYDQWQRVDAWLAARHTRAELST